MLSGSCELLRRCLSRGNHNMDVIRSTIDRVQMPAAVTARFTDLLFNSFPLVA